jgi:hypothetical protein
MELYDLSITFRKLVNMTEGMNYKDGISFIMTTCFDRLKEYEHKEHKAMTEVL